MRVNKIEEKNFQCDKYSWTTVHHRHNTFTIRTLQGFLFCFLMPKLTNKIYITMYTFISIHINMDIPKYASLKASYYSSNKQLTKQPLTRRSERPAVAQKGFKYFLCSLPTSSSEWWLSERGTRLMRRLDAKLTQLVQCSHHRPRGSIKNSSHFISVAPHRTVRNKQANQGRVRLVNCWFSCCPRSQTCQPWPDL